MMMMIIVIINISITKKHKFPRDQTSTFLEKSKAVRKVPSIKLRENLRMPHEHGLVQDGGAGNGT